MPNLLFNTGNPSDILSRHQPGHGERENAVPVTGIQIAQEGHGVKQDTEAASAEIFTGNKTSGEPFHAEDYYISSHDDRLHILLNDSTHIAEADFNFRELPAELPDQALCDTDDFVTCGCRPWKSVFVVVCVIAGLAAWEWIRHNQPPHLAPNPLKSSLRTAAFSGASTTPQTSK